LVPYKICLVTLEWISAIHGDNLLN
jgi:hypothetical protein